MKRNMGTVDRGIRFSLAVVVALLYLTGRISGVAAIILGVFAFAFFCYELSWELSSIYSIRNKDDKKRLEAA